MERQLILPTIPSGASQINDCLCVFREEEKWTYFLGMYPIYQHEAGNKSMFRFITSQLIESGSCREADIVRVFSVSRSSVSRSLRKLREEGAEAFFRPRQKRRGGRVLTEDVLNKAAGLLSEGYKPSAAAEELGVRGDTLRKAMKDGRLASPVLRCEDRSAKSSRDAVDAGAGAQMGTACTRVEERTAAAFGVCDGGPVRFEPCLDVPRGGVLLALPSLLFSGLLEGAAQLLQEVKGYYRTFHVLLLLAFMSLCRIRTVEKLRGYSPGEFGKLLGLDRIPEVRCLRRKIDELSRDDCAEQWGAHLSRYWMEKNPGAVGTLYIVRIARY